MIFQKNCDCWSPAITRTKRSNLVEKTVFTWIGLYPWVCLNCGRYLYLFLKGQHRSNQQNPT
jgi:hypothetical protein